MGFFCIGEHLPHSYSKIIHDAIGEYSYDLKELAPDEVAPFLKSGDFEGLNVTIPYKEKVIPCLDALSPAAKAIGAVNTIVRRDGRLLGHNTDFEGLRRLAGRLGLSFAGKTVFIAGTGGTAKTARAVAEAEGAARVVNLSRTPGPGMMSYDEAAEHAREAEIVVNTTPCGMFPRVDGAALDLSPFTNLFGVLDAVYNPLRTDLILQAQSMGIPAEGGLFMLVAQAVAAAEIFLDRPLPGELTERIFRSVRAEKENMVLMGMPSSGKTTVGRLLSARTGKPFLDTDEEITRVYGRTPNDIIRADGIDAFRRMEAEVIHSLAPKTGLILATGGGAVLKEENVRALKKNGRLVWLDRPPEALLVTGDRPLSDSKEKLTALYTERRPVYAAAADYTADASGRPEDIAETIAKEVFA